MAGVARFKQIQIGKEATLGTAVPATTKWRGKGVPVDLREIGICEEDVGIIAPTDRTYTAKLGAALAMDEVCATFQQLPYILNAGVKGVDGVQDGTGSDYIYTYPFSTTAVNVPYGYTIEGGDDVQAREMEYCLVTDFKLVGGFDEALRMSANWIGRQLQTCTFTPALSLPAVEEVVFNKCKMFIDASAGTHGTTEKAGTLLGADLSVATGFQAVKGADGNLYFSAHNQAAPQVVLTAKLLHDSNALAEITNWENETVRLIQLLFEGSQFATPGTTYTYHSVIVNLTGKWTNFGGLEEQDANNFVTGEFTALYNPTDAHFAEMIVVNELTALP